MKFEHGQKVRCKIKGIVIEDAKINIENNDGRMWICHNDENENLHFGIVSDKLNYKFCYYIGEGWEQKDVEFIEPINKPVKVGDIIINEFGKKCGPSTETGIFHMFEKLIEEKVIIDRIVIFSDCQIGTGCNWYDTTHTKKGDDFNKLFQKYKIINPNVKVYTIDLQGYGNTVIANGVIKISGWSDKIFSMMEFAEKENQLVDFIKEVNL